MKLLRKRRLSPNYGSIHFSFVLSAAPSAVYRRSERKILTTNGLNRRFPKDEHLRRYVDVILDRIRLTLNTYSAIFFEKIYFTVRQNKA